MLRFFRRQRPIDAAGADNRHGDIENGVINTGQLKIYHADELLAFKQHIVVEKIGMDDRGRQAADAFYGKMPESIFGPALIILIDIGIEGIHELFLLIED
ncbi:acyl- synthetase [Lasius niger]|uniref:Acyl-synthetase n=1 Tax=Lasius niger TaxID=67767 RepID=A0A0J7JVI6_LASNI|nr:acyl- synthetase [Lasius niger]